MTGNRLLLIDSNSERSVAMAEQLQLLGYSVERAECGAHGHKRTLDGDFDVILLDLNVDGRDAQVICKSLRTHHFTTPVIGLAASLTDDQTKATLAAGADAVLPTSSGISVLAAWIEAVLRRHAWFEGTYFKSHRLIKIGDLTVNVERRFVMRNGAQIELTDTEFAVVLALARNAGQVVKRSDLIAQVWGEKARDVYDDAVTAQIKRIRQKLEPSPGEPTYIRTAFRNGYVLADPEAPRVRKRSSKSAPPPPEIAPT